MFFVVIKVAALASHYQVIRGVIFDIVVKVHGGDAPVAAVAAPVAAVVAPAAEAATSAASSTAASSTATPSSSPVKP